MKIKKKLFSILLYDYSYMHENVELWELNITQLSCHPYILNNCYILKRVTKIWTSKYYQQTNMIIFVFSILFSFEHNLF